MSKSSRSPSSEKSRSRSRSRKSKKHKKHHKKRSKKKTSKKLFRPSRSHSHESLSEEGKKLACTLYVGNLSTEITASLLKKFLNGEVEKILGRPETHKSPLKHIERRSDLSSAFIEFRKPTDAELALALDGIRFEGQALRIRWPKSAELTDILPPSSSSSSSSSSNRDGGATPFFSAMNSEKLYLGGLSSHLSEADVLRTCRQFGELSEFTWVRDKLTGHPKDFAFLTYKDSDATTKAINHLNQSELGGKMVVCRLAKPGSGGEFASYGEPEHEPLENVHNLRLGASSQALMKARMNGLLGVANRPDKRLENTRGIGMYADREQPPMTLFQQQQQQRRTSVIMLLNMVTAKELSDWQEYKEILEDIKSECQKYGKLERLIIPRPVNNTSQPDAKKRLMEADVGKVFVEFANVGSAAAAFSALAGRAFARRIVVASFVTDTEWARITSTHAKF